MSKRKQRRESGASWLTEEEQESPSLQDITAQGYGLDLPASGQRIVARPISIFSITPDPMQPRRAIPTVIRDSWDGNGEGIKEMFTVWWGAVQHERGQAAGVEEIPFDLGKYILSAETERSEEEGDPNYKPGPLEAAFMKIIMLAASIRRDGLTNPVTVAKHQNTFRLETGERRWLAFHLLYAWFDGTDRRPNEQDQWETIPAREVEGVNVWRQASENNARDDLNAIGKARQYALLMMSLHGVDRFRPFSGFQNEREFYAQVMAYRGAPYGRGEELLNAMGVSSRSVLSRLRNLLELPDEIWQGADDFDLPEDMLMTLHKIAQHDPEAAIKRYREIVLTQNNSEKPSSSKPAKKLMQPGTKDHFTQMTRAVNRAGEGRHKDNAQALKNLRELRDWIEREEERIRQFIK